MWFGRLNFKLKDHKFEKRIVNTCLLLLISLNFLLLLCSKSIKPPGKDKAAFLFYMAIRQTCQQSHWPDEFMDRSKNNFQKSGFFLHPGYLESWLIYFCSLEARTSYYRVLFRNCISLYQFTHMVDGVKKIIIIVIIGLIVVWQAMGAYYERCSQSYVTHNVWFGLL
jgi:hypothetical protein